MTLKNSHNATFLQGSADGATPCDLPGYQMTLDFGLDRAPVKPSRLQESKKDLMTKDTCGRFSQNSLESASLQSSLENRLKQQLSTVGSILFKMTWKDMATPAHRRYCLLRALVPRRSDTDCIGGGALRGSRYGNPESVRLQRKAVSELPNGEKGRETEGRQTGQSSDDYQQLENPDSFGCRGRYSQKSIQSRLEKLPLNIKEQLFGRFNFWQGAEWRVGQDGNIRPVEPGTFPLAYGVPARVGRLCGYGNAIVPQVAAEFIKAFLGAKNDVAFKGQRA